MLRYNSSANIPAFIANGAGGQLVINYGSRLGRVADIYTARNRNVLGGVTVNGASYRGGKLDNTSNFHQFGPRVSLRKWSRLTFLFEVLMGTDTLDGSVPLAAFFRFGGASITSNSTIGAQVSAAVRESLETPPYR